jgi:phosphatidylglycerophosphate synthase
MSVSSGPLPPQAVRPADFLSLPNLLTMSRPILGGAVWLVRDRPWSVFGLMSVAGITDVLDGFLARRSARRAGVAELPSVGVWLDPLCDKLFIVSSLSAIATEASAPVGWMAVLVTRELMLAPLFLISRLVPALRRRRYDYHTAAIGKVTTVAQFLAVSAFVFRLRVAPVLALAAGVTGFFAAIHYARRSALPQPLAMPEPTATPAPRRHAGASP